MDIPKDFASRFFVDALLYQGQSSIIYKAKDIQLANREVAVKVFFDQAEGNGKWIAEFEDQLNKMKAASHPVLVPIITGGYERGWFYLVMELLSGKTLRDLLNQSNGVLSVDRAVSTACDLLQALGDLHSNGICHGHLDLQAVLLKEENIRLAGYCPSVLRTIRKSQHKPLGSISEVAYISSELCDSDQLSFSSDLYSIAVLLFEMITGQLPDKHSMQTLEDKLNQQNPNIKDKVLFAIKRAISQQASERYSKARDFFTDLSVSESISKNPFLSANIELPEEIGTKTIGVSMSTESIREILKMHEPTSSVSEAKPQTEAPNSLKMEASKTVYSTPVSPEIMQDAQTMMYSKADLTEEIKQMQMKPSLMIISPQNRGAKFVLERDNTILGSDLSCEISLSGKNIPSRYAIISKKADAYYICSLSQSPLVLNGQSVPNARETVLHRGDVINVGQHQVRFIEAGEVFSLQAESVDRVIDRPINKTGVYLGAIAAVLLFIGIGGFFYYQSHRASLQGLVQSKAKKQEEEKKALISRLQAEGDELFKSGALLEPIEACARKRFEQVLEINPDNTYAKRRIAEIDERVLLLKKEAEKKEQITAQVKRLIEEGDRYFESGNYIAPPNANARDSYQAVFQYEPNNPIAQLKIAEIQKILSDLVGKIKSLIAKAVEYKNAAQYVFPEGENAYELLKQVLQIDPENKEAKKLLYEMAGQSILRGDQAKASADLSAMKKYYLTAQALGVSPDYLKPRFRGTELIEKSRSAVIIVNQDQAKEAKKSEVEAGYLDSAEVERVIASLKMLGSQDSAGSNRRFIDVGAMQ